MICDQRLRRAGGKILRILRASGGGISEPEKRGEARG